MASMQLLVAIFLLVAAPLLAQTEEAAQRILASRCWTCHAATAAGGLRLDSQAALLAGGKSGPALVAGNAGSSLLWKAVTHAPGVKPMPPGPRLPDAEIATLEGWINSGARLKATTQHWAFEPLRSSSESIDEMIAAAQAKQGLQPNPKADARTLIRRVAFDLTGLPPDAQALSDQAPGWYPRLIDRLLASPHFGEKWGRHWLDVARYGEDDFSGTAVQPYANAWRYRDWVIEALNADLPYDQFLTAQIAGDLLPGKKHLAATGLFGLGPWYYGIAQPAQSRADERNDRVDMVTRGMLGVTVACARCHDHKYDPITAKDYYALSGVFASTRYEEYPVESAERVEAWKQQKKARDEAEKALNEFLDAQAKVLAKHFAQDTWRYMMATVGRDDKGLNPTILARWRKYLEKPEEFHPFLSAWFGGAKTIDEAQKFARLLDEIVAEKQAIDEDNRVTLEQAKKTAPKPKRTIVLPGGYRSEEDFNPNSYVVIRSLERNRYVAWSRTFNDTNAPLKLSRELTATLLPSDAQAQHAALKAKFEELNKALPPQYGFLAGIADDSPGDIELNLRGNPEALGELVPRRFPLVLSSGKELPLRNGSGRLELARAITEHPLAARVAVNRIWLQLFGEGLVRTPSNFGKVGDRPVLPELLDAVAARFVAGKFSVKATIREILMSEAYQRTSMANAANERTDAGNRYVWRQVRRRLDAESLRDAMLVASGELDRKLYGESKPLDAKFLRRTVYAKMSRFQQDETLSLFDLPSASVTCEQRVVTNVPLQKLFFLNSDVVAARAKALAAVAPDVEALFQRLFYRAPTAEELALGREFLSQNGKDAMALYAQVLLSTNEFAYVD